MYKKIVLIILSLFILTCREKKTSLELYTKPINKNNTTNINISTEQTKPLIKISKGDVLEIYVKSDGAPGMYADNSGNLKGFYVELEKAIMNKMGQRFNMNVYTDLGPVIIKLKNGEGHSALAVPDSNDFKSLLYLSSKIETLDFFTIVQKDNTYNSLVSRDEILKSLANKKVGVQTRGHVFQILRNFKQIKIVEYPTTTIALEALNKGELYAVPEVERIMEYYSLKNNWNLKVIGEPIFSLNITTGFSKALDPSVLERYNTALNYLIESGYVRQLYKTYFGQ